jgi:hypothetical protein
MGDVKGLRGSTGFRHPTREGKPPHGGRKATCHNHPNRTIPSSPTEGHNQHSRYPASRGKPLWKGRLSGLLGFLGSGGLCRSRSRPAPGSRWTSAPPGSRAPLDVGRLPPGSRLPGPAGRRPRWTSAGSRPAPDRAPNQGARSAPGSRAPLDVGPARLPGPAGRRPAPGPAGRRPAPAQPNRHNPHGPENPRIEKGRIIRPFPHKSLCSSSRAPSVPPDRKGYASHCR